MGIFNDILTAVIKPTEVRAVSSAILPPVRPSNESYVTVGEAFSLPAVYRAISILSIATKQMSLDVVRGDIKVTTPSLVRSPNVGMARSTFIEQTVVSLASQGNAYWLIQRDTQNRVVNLTPLNPLDMQVETDLQDVIIAYSYKGKTYNVRDIKHLRLLEVPGKKIGLGPIQAAAMDLRGTLETRDYATQWFEKSGIPSGILKTEDVIDGNEVSILKELWNGTAGGKNGVAVLGHGYDYVPVFLKPEDLQFLQIQQFNITQIARLFGVPSSLMLAENGGTTMTYANVSQEWLGFVRFSLMQYLIIIEDAMTDFLPNGQRAKFNVEAILRADTTTRYAAHQQAIAAGWMTKNEVRAIEDLPPLPEMETPVTPPAPAPAAVEPEGETNV
jgi:HK97 family phage portal protein